VVDTGRESGSAMGDGRATLRVTGCGLCCRAGATMSATAEPTRNEHVDVVSLSGPATTVRTVMEAAAGRPSVQHVYNSLAHSLTWRGFYASITRFKRGAAAAAAGVVHAPYSRTTRRASRIAQDWPHPGASPW
jgi:hypothetical protein